MSASKDTGRGRIAEGAARIAAMRKTAEGRAKLLPLTFRVKDGANVQGWGIPSLAAKGTVGVVASAPFSGAYNNGAVRVGDMIDADTGSAVVNVKRGQILRFNPSIAAKDTAAAEVAAS